MARKRFKNVSGKLQVVYDENGDKREVVPNGTLIMEEQWGMRFSRVLEIVPDIKRTKKTADE